MCFCTHRQGNDRIFMECVPDPMCRIRNLPFMAASSKKIKKALKHRQKKEGKTV